MNTTKITEDDAKKILAATQALAGVITTTLQALGSVLAAHEPAFRAIVGFVRETQADAVADERRRCHAHANDVWGKLAHKSPHAAEAITEIAKRICSGEAPR